MANNATVDSGTGITVATDDVGSGVHVQLVKLVDGTEDSATRITGSANGLAVRAHRGSSAAQTILDSTDTTFATPGAEPIIDLTNAATRVGFQLQNTGDVDLYIGFGANTTASDTAAAGTTSMLLRVGQDYTNTEFLGAISAKPTVSSSAPEIRAVEFY